MAKMIVPMLFMNMSYGDTVGETLEMREYELTQDKIDCLESISAVFGEDVIKHISPNLPLGQDYTVISEEYHDLYEPDYNERDIHQDYDLSLGESKVPDEWRDEESDLYKLDAFEELD